MGDEHVTVHQLKNLDIPPTQIQNYLVMKPIYSYALLAAFAAVGSALAVDATTTPVGYVSLGNAGSVPANTDMSVAIPLEKAAAYAGTVAVSGISGAKVTFTGTPGFTTNQFTASPFVVKIESGAKSGLVALIASNDATSATVAFQKVDTFTGVVAGDRISIRPAWTIKSFFSSNVIPNFCEFGVWNGSTGVDLAPDKVYYNFAGNWFDQADDSDANNIVIYANEGFRLRNTSTTTPITNFIVSGEVPTAKSRIFVDGAPAQQDSRISYFSPVPQTLGASGLGAGNFDQLLAYDQTTTGLDNAPAFTYYYFGSSWFNAADDSDVTNTVTISPGQAYIYRAEPGRVDTVLSNTPAYVPTL